MLINWFTVGAQALNFIILVWLMRRFLYKPILRAIAAREKRIATELADADAKKAEAKKERDEFQHKNEEFDQQRAALMRKATDEANAERQRLLEEARQAADALSVKRREGLRNDAHRLNQAIRRRTQQEVFAIVRKALTDLATTSLEERMGEVFTRRLREMDGEAKAGLGQALKTASEPTLVRSAFELPQEQRAAIQNALNETFSAEIPVRFETAPDLVSGIELTTNGQQVAWSIAEYLASLEKGVGELLKEKEKAEVQAKTPSALTLQIGKRAYELYEEQGRKDGGAAQDWEKAESEIRKETLDAAKVERKPAAKAKAKPQPEPEAKPAVKTDPEPESNVETKPEAKTKPQPEAKAEAEPAAKAEAEPAAKADPEPETKVETKPEAKAKPKPEAKTKPQPEAKAEPAAKADPEPETNVETKPEARAEPKPEAKADPAHEAPTPAKGSQ